jgi:hypothetical protein
MVGDVERGLLQPRILGQLVEAEEIGGRDVLDRTAVEAAVRQEPLGQLAADEPAGPR